MKNTGILLIGLSLLTLAIVIVLSRVTEALFVIGRVNGGTITPFVVYILIGVVFLIGLISMFNKEK